MPRWDKTLVTFFGLMVLVVGLALLALSPYSFVGGDNERLAAVLTFVGGLVTASLAFLKTLMERQSERRLNREGQQADQRLKLDAAMRAGSLLAATGAGPAEPAAVASGLLALTELDRADLAVALLVDLWRGDPPGVSNETAVLVVDSALRSRQQPNAQLVGAELLCQKAEQLDSCKSLHWPSSLDGGWDPTFGPKTKFLLIDALVWTTTAHKVNENSLRTAAVRLYGVWRGEDDAHVRGCVGRMIDALLPELRNIGYADFLQGGQRVMLAELEEAAGTGKPNPDLFLARKTEDRVARLRAWAAHCKDERLDEPGSLAYGSPSIVPAQPQPENRPAPREETAERRPR
jgi:hypothetical protein